MPQFIRFPSMGRFCGRANRTEDDTPVSTQRDPRAETGGKKAKAHERFLPIDDSTVVPEQLYWGLISAALAAEKNGQHRMEHLDSPISGSGSMSSGKQLLVSNSSRSSDSRRLSIASV